MAPFALFTFIFTLTGAVKAQILAGTDSTNAVTTAISTDIESLTISFDAETTTDADTFSIFEELDATASIYQATPVIAAADSTMSSVVSIYFPGADSLPYVASLIGQNNGVQTLAISCGPGVDADTCGFPSSVTVTAGPSTAYVSVSNQEATFIYDCQITGSTTATCAETFNGNAAYIQTSAGASTVTTSTVTKETLASSDLTWMPITITAGGKVTGQTGATATGSADSIAWGNYGSSTASTGTGTTSTGTGTTSTATGSTSTWESWGSGSGSTASTSTATTNTATTSTQTTGTQSTSTGTTSSQQSSGNGSWAGWSNAGGSSATTGWVGISSYTGAAGRLVGVGSFAAGLLAVAAMIL